MEMNIRERSLQAGLKAKVYINLKMDLSMKDNLRPTSFVEEAGSSINLTSLRLLGNSNKGKPMDLGGLHMQMGANMKGRL